jgi:thioesterase domain-containing protein
MVPEECDDLVSAADREALRGKLATEIPVTQHLGVEVVRADAEGLWLSAPLRRNVNHEGTAFAGSINAVATLAGWGWTWLMLRRRNMDAHVVLQDSTIRYLLPIDGDFAAHCVAAGGDRFDRFLRALERHGKGRLALRVEVRVADRTVATFEGRYVALAEG